MQSPLGPKVYPKVCIDHNPPLWPVGSARIYCIGPGAPGPHTGVILLSRMCCRQSILLQDQGTFTFSKQSQVKSSQVSVCCETGESADDCRAVVLPPGMTLGVNGQPGPATRQERWDRHDATSGSGSCRCCQSRLCRAAERRAQALVVPRFAGEMLADFAFPPPPSQHLPPSLSPSLSGSGSARGRRGSARRPRRTNLREAAAAGSKARQARSLRACSF